MIKCVIIINLLFTEENTTLLIDSIQIGRSLGGICEKINELIELRVHGRFVCRQNNLQMNDWIAHRIRTYI